MIWNAQAGLGDPTRFFRFVRLHQTCALSSPILQNFGVHLRRKQGAAYSNGEQNTMYRKIKIKKAAVIAAAAVVSGAAGIGIANAQSQTGQGGPDGARIGIG